MLPKKLQDEPDDGGGMRGSLVAEWKRCGKPTCRCARGQLHGPYYYRRWRDSTGRQRKEYVPRARVDQARAELERASKDTLRASLRELRRSLKRLATKSTEARTHALETVGLHWHGRRLRRQRSLPADQRDRARYQANRERIVTAVGWEISEDDYVSIQQVVRSERKRRNRLGVPQYDLDPETGRRELRISLDLSALPSYCAHMADTERELKREGSRSEEPTRR